MLVLLSPRSSSASFCLEPLAFLEQLTHFLWRVIRSEKQCIFFTDSGFSPEPPAIVSHRLLLSFPHIIYTHTNTAYLDRNVRFWGWYIHPLNASSILILSKSRKHHICSNHLLDISSSSAPFISSGRDIHATTTSSIGQSNSVSG